MNNRLEISIKEEKGGAFLRVNLRFDEPGGLFRIAAALYSRGWDMVRTEIETPVPGETHNSIWISSFLPEKGLTEERIHSMVHDLERLLVEKVSVVEYLREHGISVPAEPEGEGEVTLHHKYGQTVLEINARYRSWLLLSIFQAFYLMDISIVEGRLQREGMQIMQCRFTVQPGDHRFENYEFRDQVKSELRSLFRVPKLAEF